jgi:hypothetical protein
VAAAIESNEAPDSDVMSGANQMSEYFTELLNRKVEPRQVYTWARRKIIPTVKVAGVLTSRKSACRKTLLGRLDGD